MIQTAALPPLSYRVPEPLVPKVRPGAVVVVPLSGHARLGVVLEMGEKDRDAVEPLEEVREVVGGLYLGESIVRLCRWASGETARPLPAVLRAALPPGLQTEVFRVDRPCTGWSWRAGSKVGRGTLRRALGGEGLKAAEAEGRVVLSPSVPRRGRAEWVSVRGEEPPDLARAPRQRELLEALVARGSECPVQELLEVSGARREALRQLVWRGAVELYSRSGPSPVSVSRGAGTEEKNRADGTAGPLDGWVPESGGAWLWRLAEEEHPGAVARLARAAAESWRQTLVLVPEKRDVERLLERLADLLPAGLALAPYHSGLGEGRAAVYEAAREGAVDVLVGTRPAVLVPLSRPGAICVLDEPNDAHRAEPGYEGVPLHARDLALERARLEDSPVLFLSSAPSLTLYSKESVRELPRRAPHQWPSARIVDMRGSGAAFSSALLDACRESLQTSGGRTAVVVNRLGYATAVTCRQCGAPASCPSCGLPVALREGAGSAVCGHCAVRVEAPRRCGDCGSERMVPTGLAVERAREILAGELDAPVGLCTAGTRQVDGARVVVGTARGLSRERWETVALPDVDSALFGSGLLSSERAFRMLYRAAESARGTLLVQSRNPENPVLRWALEGDYEGFAGRELPQRRALGYPPYTHLAALTFRGEEAEVLRAVESRVRSNLGSETVASEPVPATQPGGARLWRVLLRSPSRAEVARVAGGAACSLAKRSRKSGEQRLEIEVEMDPEEV
ncbi:MAG: hypothetical protein H0V53_09550 [Rubrobacter sp.]|nr:hypothetical protein [Rubrobacter sp.]